MSVLTQTITAAQVDAKSPINERLMQAIRQDLYDLDGAIAAAGAFDYQFKINGNLGQLGDSNGLFARARRRVDGCMISKATTFSACRILLKKFGVTGVLSVDLRRYTAPNVPIQSITHLFSDTITSIGRVGSSVNTQSIARSTAQISTQSIARWKAQLSVQSIVPLGKEHELEDLRDSGAKDLVRYNLSGTVDSDWTAGSYATFASCTNGANDGSYVIVARNVDGGNNVVVSNSAAVKQDSTAGTCDLGAWKLTYTNPVSSEFAANEVVTLASHTDPANNGAFTIYATNQSGNNIIIKNRDMVAQGSPAGNANCNRWKYALSAPAASDYVVGEYALTQAHTTIGNNSILPITAVNSGGSNVVVYNPNGAAQAGAAGTVDTCRWSYSFATDPSGGVSVGDLVWTLDATDFANRGQFSVVQVNRSSGLNVVVANIGGLTQAGSGGTLYTTKVKLKFGADQSSYMSTVSRLTLYGLPPDVNGRSLDSDYDVVEVNRGGGSNYNAVVNFYGAVAGGACGRVVLESKSLFDTPPSIDVDALGTDYGAAWCYLSTNAVFNSTRKSVTANTLVMMDLTGVPLGNPEDLTVQLL